jgi:hypothetical protein
LLEKAYKDNLIFRTFVLASCSRRYVPVRQGTIRVDAYWLERCVRGVGWGGTGLADRISGQKGDDRLRQDERKLGIVYYLVRA